MRKEFKLVITYAAFLAAVTVIVSLVLMKNNLLYMDLSFLSSHDSNEYEKIDANKKYVILTFDDCWASQYEAFKRIYPLKGTLYICPSFVGEKDRLSLENLREMYKNGWDISNHTMHHKNLTKLDEKKVYDEVKECSKWLIRNKFTRNSAYKHFAYPEGAYSDEIKEILKKQGIITARTTNAGNAATDLLELGRTSLYGMAKKNIRIKMLSDEKLIILSFHRIAPDDAEELKEIDIPESYFLEAIDAIKESKREVITMTEWYEMSK